MGFLVRTDYDAIINSDELDFLTNDDSITLEKAEKMAISRIKHWLSKNYDVNAIFNAVGDARDETVIQYVIYLTLYTLYTKIAKVKIPDDRFVQYKEASRFFEAVAKDEIDTTLPKKAANAERDFIDFYFSSDNQYTTNY